MKTRMVGKYDKAEALKLKKVLKNKRRYMIMTDGKLPLGIMRQAVMKMDSFISDIHECMEDEDVSDDQKYTFSQIVEMASSMQAAIVNMANSEMDETEFLNENIPLDEIDPYPGTTNDLLDESI